MGSMVEFAWDIVDDVAIVVHGAGSPAAQEFRECLAALERLDGRLRGMLAVAAGGGPTALQRAEIVRRFRRLRHVPFILVSDSRFSRGVFTALGWLLPDARRNMRAFARKDVDAAVECLAREPARRRRVQTAVLALEERVATRTPGDATPPSTGKDRPRLSA